MRTLLLPYSATTAWEPSDENPTASTAVPEVYERSFEPSASTARNENPRVNTISPFEPL